MVYRTNGYMGCLIGILFMLVFLYLIRFTGWIFFSTPVGLLIVGYFIYRHYQKKRNIDNSNNYETHHYHTNEHQEFDTSDVVDVDYEDYDE